MIKCKIFSNQYHSKLEDDINSFLKKNIYNIEKIIKIHVEFKVGNHYAIIVYELKQ
jgi:hypothetical protein